METDGQLREMAAKLAQSLRGWADAAEPAWKEATDAGEDSLTMHRAFIGVGMDNARNAALLLELLSP